MKTTTKSRRGRPTKPYVTSWGEHINGLRRRENDGRWVVVSTKAMFSEPDERLAIARFKSMNGETPIAFLSVPSADIAEQSQDVSHAIAAGAFPAVGYHVTKDGCTETTNQAVNLDLLWPWVRDQILKRPKYVAEQTGIEQIGYLADLKKPLPSPKLVEVGDFFFNKKQVKISDNWIAKCKASWNEFVDFVDVPTLRDVTQDHIIDYGDMTEAKRLENDFEPPYTRQRFQAVKSIINFPPKRGKWADDCRVVYGYCSALVAPKQSKPKPQPISREHFYKLLNAADDQTAAILLVSLNACMYGGETAALDWSEINLDSGEIITSRNKTGVIRVAVLWQRTIKALKSLPRSTEAVFITTGTKMKHNYQTVYKAFKSLRDKVHLTADDVQFSHIRDGAYTTAIRVAVRNRIPLDFVKLLAGHSMEIADKYAAREPQMVAELCSAAEKEYFD